jgi:2-phospho-L-lactate transferase/gluconeogenesis factor (CofD/UPF0052 family)
MKKTKVLVFCGGEGAKALQEGFFHYFSRVTPQYAINMYDDGQSSGICRQLFGILGPSDLRKIQLFQHCLRFGQTPLFSFLEKRLTVGPETKKYIFFQIKKLSGDYLTAAQAETLRLAATLFFEKIGRPVFKNFSLANILYSGLIIKENLNYSAVEELMAEILKIPPQTVVINSYQSLFLKGVTEKGKIVNGECRVDYGEKDDPFKEVILVDEKGKSVFPSLSAELKNAVKKAKIIVFSCGHYWASLIPTLKTQELRKLLNESLAKKFLVMNNQEGSDMKGLASDKVQEIVYRYLPPQTVTLFNSGAEERMKKRNPDYPSVDLPLSAEGEQLHHPRLLSQAIMTHGFA